MFRIFKKRQNVFLKLIHDQASLTLEGLEALKTFMISTTGSFVVAFFQRERSR